MPTEPLPADRRLAAQALAADDPTGWFEPLYVEAAAGTSVVPWDREDPNPLLAEWFAGRSGEPGGTALVVGCGYGTDAEHVAAQGFRTTAFDVSPTAIDGALTRFPHSPVTYTVADLLAPPAAWRGVFDLVVESITVQSLPPQVHAAAIAGIRAALAPGATLLVVADVSAATPTSGPPWPLTRAEIESFGGDDIAPVHLDLLPRPDIPGLHRWRAEFRRAAG
ncbi:class I SAM-dependent methyltransferase [Nocardia sp. NPDC059177]|uniref:class I SAM-dependent methyltransferase n=1 Tax=Nocardia sp. NPDC059177 TaxID=3346759 RepID=UPI0036C3450D